MESTPFFYQLGEDTVFFSATLRKGRPYIAQTPRDHESLFVVTSGSLLYEKQGVRQIIRRGEVGYIARGSCDSSSAFGSDEVSYIAVNFSFKKVTSCSPTLPFAVLASIGDTSAYERLFGKAHSAFISKKDGYLAVCNGLLLQIIGLLYGEYKKSNSGKGKEERIHMALKMINERYDRVTLRIEELAKASNMSSKNFRRVFFEVKGMNPYEYLQNFRISKAEILLLNTSEPISEIAAMCGFSDVYSFSHSFKKHTNVSPADYRISRI